MTIGSMIRWNILFYISYAAVMFVQLFVCPCTDEHIPVLLSLPLIMVLGDMLKDEANIEELYIFKSIFILIEDFLYDHLYQTYNGPIPSTIYKLNNRYQNTSECPICWEDFYGSETTILHCGHRYHNDCLRSWELRQFEMKAHRSYRCSMCRTDYNWTQKWNYVNINQD